MQPQSPQDYKQLLTDVIKKQIVILGPDITLSKARNVKGLTVQDDGTVTNFVGSPQEVTQALIDQFVQLSGLIVKKTMEPLLLGTQPSTTSPTPAIATPATSATPTPQMINPQSPQNETALPQTPQPAIPVNPAVQGAPQTPKQPVNTVPAPAANPLAA